MIERRKGFTLAELLAVIGIVFTLLALLAMGVRTTRLQAGKTIALSQMRQIGLGIAEYANDHQGTLPGPLAAAQGSRYIPNRNDQLATLLGPYLGVIDLDREQVVKVFLPPILVRAVGAAAASQAVPYVMNISATADNAVLKPWGSAIPPLGNPLKFNNVPGTVWALCDADQRNPLVAGQPWAVRTPPRTIHGMKRFALYLNGSAGAIDEDSLKMPAPPPSLGGARP